MSSKEERVKHVKRKTSWKIPIPSGDFSLPIVVTALKVAWRNGFWWFAIRDGEITIAALRETIFS